MSALLRTVRRLGRAVVLVGTVVVCLLGLIVISGFEASRSADPGRSDGASGAPVTVLDVEPSTHAALVTALGEARPVWESTIRAEVDGGIEFVSASLEPGSRLREGDVLVRLEPSAYIARVSDARNQLHAARTELMREERRAIEAREDWRRSGIEGEPDSALTLRIPQLELARSAVDAAADALVHAEQQLGRTEIRAPFDGVVVSRAVDPGESVFAGDVIGVMYALSALEIALRLDAAQWSLLPADPIGLVVPLEDPWGGSAWHATVVREALEHERESRLRTLYLRVGGPLDHDPPLLPGMFVRAGLRGRDVPGTLRLPQSCLTKAGSIWTVDADNTLRRFPTEPVFFGEGVVYVRAPADGAHRVVVSPNSSFIAGQRVQPISASEGR